MGVGVGGVFVVYFCDLVSEGLLLWNLVGSFINTITSVWMLVGHDSVFVVSDSPQSVPVEEEIGFFLVKCRWFWYIVFDASAEIFAYVHDWVANGFL